MSCIKSIYFNKFNVFSAASSNSYRSNKTKVKKEEKKSTTTEKFTSTLRDSLSSDIQSMVSSAIQWTKSSKTLLTTVSSKPNISVDSTESYTTTMGTTRSVVVRVTDATPTLKGEIRHDKNKEKMRKKEEKPMDDEFVPDKEVKFVTPMVTVETPMVKAIKFTDNRNSATNPPNKQENISSLIQFIPDNTPHVYHREQVGRPIQKVFGNAAEEYYSNHGYGYDTANTGSGSDEDYSILEPDSMQQPLSTNTRQDVTSIPA